MSEFINPLSLTPDEREETSAERWAKVNEYRIKNGMEPIKTDDDDD